jgi:hypothetical protein
MFEDIKEADANACAYSIVRPDGQGGDAVNFANSVLAGASQLVNWADPRERGAFLEERKRVADAV